VEKNDLANRAAAGEVVSARTPDRTPKPKTVRNRQFLKVSEVAEDLNIGERSAWRLIKNEKLPTYRFGNSTRIKRKDLDAYIKRCRK
jgi:excisionase family DNA binding protein